MMLVPTTCSVTTAADMTLVRSRPLAPETDALIVAGILTAREAPHSLEFTLPASAKALSPIGVFVAPEPLFADARGAIPFVVVRHLDLGASPERGRVPNGSPGSCNPVYERLYHPRVSSAHLILLSFYGSASLEDHRNDNQQHDDAKASFAAVATMNMYPFVGPCMYVSVLHLFPFVVLSVELGGSSEGTPRNALALAKAL